MPASGDARPERVGGGGDGAAGGVIVGLGEGEEAGEGGEVGVVHGLGWGGLLAGGWDRGGCAAGG